jgi:hypothetical protein
VNVALPLPLRGYVGGKDTQPLGRSVESGYLFGALDDAESDLSRETFAESPDSLE